MIGSRTASCGCAVLALAVALIAALLAPGCVATIPAASAASRAKPCPTTGKLLAKQGNPRSDGRVTRVWRVGSQLWACTKIDGRRRLGKLGRWTRDTRIALDDSAAGNVAWASRRTVAGRTSDIVRTIDLDTGRMWLHAAPAVPATGPASPAGDDLVVGLRAGDGTAAWVTAGGAVAFAMRRIDPSNGATNVYPVIPQLSGEGVTAQPYRDGHRFLLRTVPAAAAATVARRLRFTDDGFGDGCDYTTIQHLRIPGASGDPEWLFTYRVVNSVPDGDDVCNI